jgi:hypothetical protein
MPRSRRSAIDIRGVTPTRRSWLNSRATAGRAIREPCRALRQRCFAHGSGYQKICKGWSQAKLLGIKLSVICCSA